MRTRRRSGQKGQVGYSFPFEKKETSKVQHGRKGFSNGFAPSRGLAVEYTIGTSDEEIKAESQQEVRERQLFTVADPRYIGREIEEAGSVILNTTKCDRSYNARKTLNIVMVQFG